MRFELMYDSFFKIIQGIPLTLEVVFLSTIFGLFLAVGVALMRVSNNKILSNFAYYFIYNISFTEICFDLIFNNSVFSLFISFKWHVSNRIMSKIEALTHMN